MILDSFSHPKLGKVTIIASRTARQISVNRTAMRVRITLPYGVSGTEAREAINRILVQLEKTEVPGLPTYEIGQRIECPDVTFLLERQSLKPGFITAMPQLPVCSIGIGRDVDIHSRRSIGLISQILCRSAADLAPELILPRAREISAELGVAPKSWSISRGHTTLGTCYRDGRITISSLVVFLPRELRDYIICHELAHLTEMNHSARFHQLCDSYLQGHEKELIRKLNAFRWPVIR